ncbi:ABC-type dipeptide/oligopeptide/nickel transport system, ATPase component [Rivularia sp. PCC 7116]|uniref:dynamin family protein n=1 Tax=Rivularia sp. PCC 7116 TaxID=373994 RepID=UPI00029F0A01|nr:dynamin family protein [Rivularia sp. PCC 7116]AFY54509.1 ABC-type dipeptide/oligopeptide/nickel transport system, ATPase component [Rivularia sp. PCC 7116]
MVAEVLRPNVQDLQQDVIKLLGQISDLMSRASSNLSSDEPDNKYIDFEKHIRNETSKVENLELRMAIVAPMKAGKSTIVNAIAGQDILPSRNSAMTTLPTEIIFDGDLKQPILTLNSGVVSVFQDTLVALREKIKERGLETIRESLANYPHLQKYPKLIQELKVGESIPRKSEGRQNIALTLTSLNDIVRVCSILDPQSDPIQYLEDVPKIKTPFWRAVGGNQANTQGKLVIVDTPGPNEAGENLRLQAVVAEQLVKSSIVLIVLDFTQLKNEAAEKVKQDVQRVIELRGKDNLYVLVNKVDQRRDGDMNPNQVRNFVAAEFGIDEIGDKNRVFEISARRAFTSANFLMELQQSPNTKVSELKTVRALAQEVFGIDWEEELEDATIAQLQRKAERLWKKSGFEPFLNDAIAALMREAAPRCMSSALKIARSNLTILNDDVQLRSSAINQDDEKIRLELEALKKDLESLNECRNRLQEINTIRENLENNLDNLLIKLKKNAKMSLEKYFKEEEYERGNVVQKVNIQARDFLSQTISEFERFPLFTQWIPREMKSQIEFKSSGIFEFKNEVEAENFANQAVAYSKVRAEDILSAIRKQARTEIAAARSSIMNFVDTQTKPIIKNAQQRLNEVFDVNLSLPQPNLASEDIEVSNPYIKRNTKHIEQGYEYVERRERKWWSLWLIPVTVKERVKKPDKEVKYFTVYLEDVISQVNDSLEKSIDDINSNIRDYIEDDFQQRINIFFNELNIYLTNYSDNLRLAQADQKKKTEEKNQLIYELNSLISESKENIKDTSYYLERIKQLMEKK